MQYNKKGFTMIEALIAVAVIILFIAIAFSSNIMLSFGKSRDAKRKTDLYKLSRILEDYYNDHNQYPPAIEGLINGIAWGQSFPPYTNQLPINPGESYLYMSGYPNEHYYVLFTKLDNPNDEDSVKCGCQMLCGPPTETRRYNYVVHSENISMINGIPELTQ